MRFQLRLQRSSDMLLWPELLLQGLLCKSLQKMNPTRNDRSFYFIEINSAPALSYPVFKADPFSCYESGYVANPLYYAMLPVDTRSEGFSNFGGPCCTVL